ncbi:Ig-like domain-containing protein [Thermococcus barophilus]|uniref:DUF4129 domain-containing protein n=1 Tax=Thermococcus barophilus (strain DSM 11836 / MP) TaxID=391623 RepID=F0LLZ0_THEBM|nr:Ig-like domain-containing protein [Thermococcus barophilus]ADT85089.1 hypothetical protein TERMP_02115 [Thermococcus barophilus MP]
MKRVLVFVIVLLIASSGLGLALDRHIPYEIASENDKGIYIYLKSILLYSDIVLKNIIDENNDSVNYALKLETRLNMTREEVEFYKTMGIESKIEKYLPPFLKLGKGIKEIAEGQKIFLDNIEKVKTEKDYYSYMNATKGLNLIKEGISLSEEALDEIDVLEFLDENNVTVKLDTTQLRERLEEIKRMYLVYEKILRAYQVLSPEELQKLIKKEEKKTGKPVNTEEFIEKNRIIPIPERLTLHASKLNPFVYENVTFYGYAPGFNEVEIHIGNESFAVPVRNNYFSLKHVFKQVGSYRVFATGMRENKLETSNILLINVSKIPTNLIISSEKSAYVDQKLRIEGILLDYYRNPLGAQEIRASFDGEKLTLKTLKNGSFSFEISRKKEGKYLVNVTYLGNEIYAGSSASLSVYFMRHPVDIKIKTDKAKVKIGQELYIFGEVKGAKRPILISVYVDGKLYQQWLTKTVFGFKLRFNSTGTHEIYAYFSGDEYYAPAKSNLLKISVIKYSFREILIIALAFVSLLVLYVFVSSKKGQRKGISDEEFVELIKSLEELEVKEEGKKVKRLRDIYREVYYKLISYYNLKPTLTPRELLRKLRNESFSYDLERLTQLHERYFYGRKRLKRNEVIEYIKSAGRVIVSFIVREEL